MLPRNGWFVLLIIIFVSDYSYPHERKCPTSVACYDQGLMLANEGKVQSAIEALSLAIKKDRKFADAYHQLALLYMRMGTVESRRKATWALEHALRLEGRNVEYQMAMAKLFLKKGMKQVAKRRLNKVLELDPDNAEAYFHLGLIKEEDMLWYKDLINPNEYTVFSYADYAIADMSEARDYFEKAVQLEPDFALAYYHLALIQYELSDFASAEGYLRKAAAVQPQNRDFYLFLGLVFQRTGNYDSSYASYNRAIKYMSDEERALFDSVEPLLTPVLREQYKRMSAEDQSRYAAIFWKQRDPLFLTEHNERVLEHYSRLAYVNLRFGDSERGVDGWATDQGQTYIRYGPPKTRFRTRPTVELRSGGNPLIPSAEYWKYDTFALAFEDPYLSRTYAFKRSFEPDHDSKYLFERRIHEVPETYNPDFGGETSEVPALISQFQGDAGKTRIEVYFGIPRKRRGIRQRAHHNRSLKKGFFVFDSQWNEVARIVDELNVTVSATGPAPASEYILDSISYTLTAGNYHIAVELVDRNSGNVGRYLGPLQVRAFEPRQLDMSDLLVATNIHANSDSSEEGLQGLTIIANLFKIYKSDEPVFVYYEIYNLEVNEAGQSNYKVETKVTPLERRRGLVSNLAIRLGLKQEKDYSLSTSYDYFGNSSMQRLYNSVKIDAPRIGKYVLEIKTTDLNNGDSVEKDVVFEIVD